VFHPRCNTLQHTATHCNTLQHTADEQDVCCSVFSIRLRGTASLCTFNSVLQCVAVVAVCCSVSSIRLRGTALLCACCSVLQCVVVCRSVLQCV